MTDSDSPAGPVLARPPVTTIPGPFVHGEVVKTAVSDPLKPGWQTSEFWTKIAAFALSMLLASGAITNNVVLAAIGIAANMIGASVYTMSRTKLKLEAIRGPEEPL